jgi:hypothetical protein
LVEQRAVCRNPSTAKENGNASVAADPIKRQRLALRAVATAPHDAMRSMSLQCAASTAWHGAQLRLAPSGSRSE